MSDDLLMIAFKDLPGDVVKAPAYPLKDELGRYAIELPAHVVVAVKGFNSVPEVGSSVSITQDAIIDAERLGYKMIVYVHAKKLYYLTDVSTVKQEYIFINHCADRPMWVVPLRALTEHTQAKANAMQGVLLL